MAAKPKSKKKAGSIAERERDVLALRESEERLRLAQQVAHIGTFEWNIQTGVNRWTPELETMYGLQTGSFPGTFEAWEQLVHPDDRPEAVRRVNEAMEKGGFEGEWRVVWPDGTVRWLYGRSFVFKDESGKPLKLIGVNIDITERKCMEEELRRSRDELDERVKEKTAELFKTKEELAQRVAERTGELQAAHQSLVEKSRYLDAFFNHTITPLVLLDRDFNFIRVNEAYARACQKDVGEFPGHNHFEFYPSDARVIFEDVIRTRQPVLVNARPFVFPDHPELGVTYWNWTLTPLLDDRGEVEALVFALEDVTERKQAEIELEKHRDQLQELVRERTLDLENANDQLRYEITERKRTEKSLRESEERFSAFMDNNPADSWMKDEQGAYVFLNKACGERIGIGLDDWLWKTDHEIFPRDVADRLRENDREVLASGSMIIVEEETVSPDGHRIQWLSVKFPFKDALGNRFVGGIAVDISEHKRAEEALRESEEKFRQLAENIYSIFWISEINVTTGMRYAYMSPAFEHIFGIPVERIYQDPRLWLEMIHPDDKEHFMAAMNKRMSGDYYNVNVPDFRIVRPDGTIRWIKARLYPVMGEDGTVHRFVGIADDVTERKRAEEALRESEAKFRALFEGAGAAIFVADVATGEIIDCNRKAEELTGRSKEEIIGLHQTQLHPADNVKVQRDQFKYHARGVGINNEAEVQHQDGRVIPVIINATPLKINGREIMIGFFLDITERKRAEEALRDNERFLNNVLDNITDGISVLDRDLNIIRVNRTMEKWHPDALPLVGKKCYSAYHCRSEPCVLCPSQKTINERAPQISIVPRDVDGKTVGWQEVHSFPLLDDAGNVAGVINYVRDITERKRTEDALQESEEKFRALAEASSAMIWLYQGERFVFVNGAGERLTGYTIDELLRMRFWDVVHPEDRDLVRERGLARQRGEEVPGKYEVKLLTKDGKTRWAELTAGRIEYRGEPAGIATFFDITERRRAEEALKEAKQQAELYLDLMGHDINNMHQIALGYMEIARDMHPVAGQGEFLDKPIEVLQRSARLIQNVRKLQKLKDGVFQTQEVDACELLVDVQREFGAVPHKAITLNLNRCERCHVRANELLHDVFANLVSNAIKHTGDRADIAIDLDIVEDNDGLHCRFVVEDNGPGIPDDFKKVIFNRVLKGTDKAKGMGLGLYLVKSLVESYDGKVWVEDRVKGDHTKGAKFVVMLPATETERH
jgi:PAS domain S-box-containing protein